MTLAPRVVVVTRSTPYEELLVRHSTRSQAEFYLKGRGQSLASVEAVHHRIHAAVALVQAAIPLDWRRNLVARRELDRFRFEPEDTIAVVGQDGLVANVAKYLDGQPVIGINPTPELFDGVLVAHSPDKGARLLLPVARREIEPEPRTMVEAVLDDGQTLCALNEIFLGHRTHQSAKYEISHAAQTVVHSSSGIIVTTGTGATGWARSIHLERHSNLGLPGPTDPHLAFFVREAFPSVATSIEVTEGVLEEEGALRVVSRMENGVIFGDGIEQDYLRFEWGARVEVRIAKKRLQLIGREHI
jgi:NAD kinase